MIKSGKGYSYWLARFNREMSFHFPWVVPLISDRSVWHNGKQPFLSMVLTEMMNSQMYSFNSNAGISSTFLSLYLVPKKVCKSFTSRVFCNVALFSCSAKNHEIVN